MFIFFFQGKKIYTFMIIQEEKFVDYWKKTPEVLRSLKISILFSYQYNFHFNWMHQQMPHVGTLFSIMNKVGKKRNTQMGNLRGKKSNKCKKKVTINEKFYLFKEAKWSFESIIDCYVMAKNRITNTGCNTWC